MEYNNNKRTTHYIYTHLHFYLIIVFSGLYVHNNNSRTNLDDFYSTFSVKKHITGAVNINYKKYSSKTN